MQAGMRPWVHWTWFCAEITQISCGSLCVVVIVQSWRYPEHLQKWKDAFCDVWNDTVFQREPAAVQDWANAVRQEVLGTATHVARLDPQIHRLVTQLQADILRWENATSKASLCGCARFSPGNHPCMLLTNTQEANDAVTCARIAAACTLATGVRRRQHNMAAPFVCAAAQVRQVCWWCLRRLSA